MTSVLVAPSPKAQLYETPFVEVLVKAATAPFTAVVKPAAGPGLTVIKLVCVAVLLPAAFETVKVTVYVPGVLYTTPGF